MFLEPWVSDGVAPPGDEPYMADKSPMPQGKVVPRGEDDICGGHADDMGYNCAEMLDDAA